MMRIACSSSVLYGREAFSTLGEVAWLPDRAFAPETVRDADLLIVRSQIKAGAALLRGSSVRFVGTVTAGYDHFDVPFLEDAGIAWCAAPGCNADSVAEYVAAALLRLACRSGVTLGGLTMGVIGVGQVGSRVVQKACALGMNVLRNDPPLREATGDPAYLPMDEVLARAELLTLHVPLTFDGPCPTYDMVDEPFWRKVKPACILLNAARGQAVEPAALLRALETGTVRHAVLDVWDPEPAFPAHLLALADLGTAHIAGHSFEAKLNGTGQVYREACRFLGREPTWDPRTCVPPAPRPRIDLQAVGRSDEPILDEAVRQVYDIEADDRALREGVAGDDAARGAYFEHLRRTYRPRREFFNTEVKLVGGSDSLAAKLRGLGFRLCPVGQ